MEEKDYNKEKLECIAKALKIDLIYREEGQGEYGYWQKTTPNNFKWTPWNPIERNEDAFLLMVRLAATLDFHSLSFNYGNRGIRVFSDAGEGYGKHPGDLEGTTRMAIVLAAYKYGLNHEKQEKEKTLKTNNV